MRRFAIIAALLLATCSIVGGQGKPIVLRYKYVKGAVDTYRMVTSVKVTSSDRDSSLDVPSKRVTTITRRVLNVLPNGSAKLQITSVDADPVSSTETVSPKILLVTVSKAGKVISATRVDGAPVDSGSVPINPDQITSNLGIVLPSRSMKTGQSWQQVTALTPTSGKLHVTSTIVSTTARVGRVSAVKVGQVFSGRAKMTLPASGKSQGLDAQSDSAGKNHGIVDITGSSSFYFSPTLGKLIGLDKNLTSSLRLDSGQKIIVDVVVSIRRMN